MNCATAPVADHAGVSAQGAGPAWSLPAWVYDSDDFLALEKSAIFSRQWLAAGHVSDLPGPGDYLSLDVGDERVLVIRDEQGRLRAFHNVCRHRASRLVSSERGNCPRAIVCPYHGWTYGFDGTLRGVPERETFPGLDPSKLHLPAVDLEVWMGFVFVRIGTGGPSVAGAMAPFAAELAPYRLDALEPLSENRQVVAANWKCIIDNDSEGYHVPRGHPGLQRLYGRTYRDESWPGGVSRSAGLVTDEPSGRWSERLYKKLLPQSPHLPRSHQRMWLYYGVFPSFSLAVYPDQVEYFQVIPTGIRESLVVSRCYALPDPRREMPALRWLNARINAQVWREDLTLVRGMEAGLRSSSYTRGPLSDKEVCVRQFHDRIRSLIPVARLVHPPADGVDTANRRMCAEAGPTGAAREARPALAGA